MALRRLRFKVRKVRRGTTRRKPVPQKKGKGAKSRIKALTGLGISDARLERGLRVLSETKDIAQAARSIRVSEERFKRVARRKAAIRKRKGFWTVVRRLPRKMPIFSGGRHLAITVNSKSASFIARYMSAVGQFLKSNDPKFLVEFKSASVKDASGKVQPFETDPNTLYRLSSAGGEPFEDVYRIVI
jgi:hypothetical protein